MTLIFYVLLGWALLSGALTLVVAALIAREHLRVSRGGEAVAPGDDLLDLRQALAARRGTTYPVH